MKQFNRIVEAQLEAQRWGAQQAQREQRALNGEMGVEAQIVALSAMYQALRASGQHEAAAAVKAQAAKLMEVA